MVMSNTGKILALLSVGGVAPGRSENQFLNIIFCVIWTGNRLRGSWVAQNVNMYVLFDAYT